ncbi:hypothetical protein PHYBOEH_004448 [Phytophthora boehmeriae]|uniref:Uncharacterized protein n=1 Tax=Phytophthora boehmeriae TaxID=109152 RepID=A0A8T1WLZ5_9STRA|nr:hypothetical protein PHYBOEH_004448 [Phytophthora boehmeriae]
MKALLLALMILCASEGSTASSSAALAAPVYEVTTCYATNDCNEHDTSKRIVLFPSTNCASSSCVQSSLPWEDRPYCDFECMSNLSSSMSYAESKMTEHPYVVEQTFYSGNNCSSTPVVDYHIVTKDNCIVTDDGTDGKPAASAICSITGTGDFDWTELQR